MGLVLLFTKLPRKVRRFLTKHAVFTDFVTFILTYYTLGGSLTALTAGAIVGVVTSALLYIHDHPEDFMYLYDLYEALKIQVKSLKESLNKYGQQYRDSKTPVLEVPAAA